MIFNIKEGKFSTISKYKLIIASYSVELRKLFNSGSVLINYPSVIL
jgi:hypothetical protein